MNPFDLPKSASLARFDSAMRADSYASGLANLYTGLGDSNYDPTGGFSLRPNFGLAHNEFAQVALEEEGMLRKAIHSLSGACTSKWGNVLLAEENDNVAQEIMADLDDVPILTEMDELSGLKAGIEECLNYAFMSGNAALIPMLDDGLDPSEPLDPKAIRQVEGFFAMDRWSVQPQWRNFSGPPTHYQISMGGSSAQKMSGAIHSSRVYWIRGIPRSVRARQHSGGFDASLFESLARPYMLYRSAVENSGRMLQDFDVIFHKIEDLAKMVCEAEEEELRIARGELSPVDAIATTRLAALRKKLNWGQKHRSIHHEYVGDMQGETFEHITRSVGGYRDLADYVKDFMGAASEFSPMILFGETSGAGMNSGGKSKEDRELWNDTVDRTQASRLTPHMTGMGKRKGRKSMKPPGLLNLLCLAKQGPTNGDIPKGLGWEWNTLYQSTPEENAALESQYSTIASTYAAIDPRFLPNAILSRFGNNKTSAVNLSPEYVKALQAEVKDAKKPEPEAPPEAPAEAPPEEPAETEAGELTPEEEQELAALEAADARSDSTHLDAIPYAVSQAFSSGLSLGQGKSWAEEKMIRIAAKLAKGYRPTWDEQLYLSQWLQGHRHYASYRHGSPQRTKWLLHGGDECDRWLKRRQGHRDSAPAEVVPVHLRADILSIYQELSR